MPARHRLNRPIHPGAWLAVGAALWLAAASVNPQSQARKAPEKSRAPAATEAAQRQQALRTQRQELITQLAALKRRLAASESTLVEAADALKASEQAVSEAARRLRELARSRAQVEAQIAALQARERNAAGRQRAEEARLDEVLRALQRHDAGDPLQQLLAGQSPGQIERESDHLAALARAAEGDIAQLRERRAELGQLERESRDKRDELAAIERDEADNRAALQREQARQKRTANELARQIAAQRGSIAKLERDEKRLGTLLDQLGRILAEQAQRDAERARQARSNRPPAAPSKGAGEPKAPDPVEIPTTATNFPQLKGRLSLPVQGQITARFGSPRRGESSGPAWKGLFIQAPTGAEVRAVGAGRVVFADWLRGFGNLMVIDHGGSYLSVYGYNETLLRSAGDSVEAAEPIATVGNSGGSEVSGLYFELRFQGRPFDPLGWVAAR